MNIMYIIIIHINLNNTVIFLVTLVLSMYKIFTLHITFLKQFK